MTVPPTTVVSKPIEAIISEALSTIGTWTRNSEEFGNHRQVWWETFTRVDVEERRLVVLLRPDGDLQVEFHLPSKAGTPFEILFPLEPEHEATVVREVRNFVAELLNEHLVLVYDRRW